MVGIIAAWMQKIPRIESSWKIEGGRVLRLKLVENKSYILKDSKKINGWELWLEDVATGRKRGGDTILVGERRTEDRGNGFVRNSKKIRNEGGRDILELERGLG